jgi:aminoglycoside phosphotransferase (APT) family kinase protein
MTAMSFNAAAVRPRWGELPPALRASIERRLGSAVTSSVEQNGGFTHGAATRLLLADDSRAFAKAMPADDALAGMYREEAACAARLPARVPAPRFRFSLEEAGWIALVFDDVEGRHPDLAEPADLLAVLLTLERLAETLTPSPLPDALPVAQSLAPLLNGWRTYAAGNTPADLDAWSLRNLDRLGRLEAEWVEASAGNTLLHADLRPDNMVLARTGRIFVVDWACTCIGAAWVDLVVLLGSVAGVDAEAIVSTHPLTRDVDPLAIDAFVCALLGCWEKECREPEVPTSPQLRRFQARNAGVTRAWLARRTGWR